MTMKDIERRLYVPDQLRLAPAAEGSAAVIHGHAAVFGQLSEDLGGFREKIAPGAFASTIKGRDIRALLNHESTLVLGRTGAGTLRLQEDDQGLQIEIDLPETTYANDLLVSMKRGDINQMSFGFYTISDHWEKVDGGWVRTLLEVELIEVSPVTFPAYTQTSVSARSLDAWSKAKGELAAPPAYGPEDEYRELQLRLQAARH